MFHRSVTITMINLSQNKNITTICITTCRVTYIYVYIYIYIYIVIYFDTGSKEVGIVVKSISKVITFSITSHHKYHFTQVSYRLVTIVGV